MSLETINEYILILDQEIGGFDLLEAFRLAKEETMEGWDTIFSLDGFTFTFYSYFGEDWADMRSADDILCKYCQITPYGWHIYEN